MSLLIKGMEMPTKCPCRLVGIGYDMYCFAVDGIPARVKEYNACCKHGTKPSWCPFVAVPEHGRLIDADKLNALIDQSYPMTDRYDVHNGYAICQELIKMLPTIIEAEDENNG